MNCISSVKEFVEFFGAQKESYAGTCVTIGNFDGVHVGHQALLRRTAQKARERNLLSVVLTFWPHPLTVLAGLHAPIPLITRKARAEFVTQYGIDSILELEFTKEIAELSPESFVSEVLRAIGCKELVVGYDFSLGKGRKGNFEVLQSLGSQYDINVEQLSPVIVHNAVVSSTRIRQMVRTGEVYEAEALLGRYPNLDGLVVHGYGRGEGLGFPTANMETEPVLIPRTGVYATVLTVLRAAPDSSISELTSYPAVTNVGHVPTFGNDALSVESFILRGNPNLYGARVRLSFVQYIRDEQRFDNVGELKERIAKDVQLAKEILDVDENI